MPSIYWEIRSKYFCASRSGGQKFISAALISVHIRLGFTSKNFERFKLGTNSNLKGSDLVRVQILAVSF